MFAEREAAIRVGSLLRRVVLTPKYENGFYVKLRLWFLKRSRITHM